MSFLTIRHSKSDFDGWNETASSDDVHCPRSLYLWLDDFSRFGRKQASINYNHDHHLISTVGDWPAQQWQWVADRNADEMVLDDSDDDDDMPMLG